MVNYNQRKFRPATVSDNGEVSQEVIFEYFQEGQIVTSSYAGGSIAKGQLIGLVDKEGNIDMRYHQILHSSVIQTGICFSKPEVLEDGRIRLHETWQWTSGNFSKGTSIIEEI
ncbi:hypothetical protein [Portibacter lacus]|uniref:N-acetylglutamate synthase n=1 Tax=Portibacter lacus TaxID=1099794 RepID=A0AA37STI9_9BACT|nr:hypothetical protein [Portibacter lacus]GLR18576.1 hypothetical protein GCM10007940_31920 [Portibacter lacus]